MFDTPDQNVDERREITDPTPIFQFHSEFSSVT